ncbi:putative peptidylprolyl isomerase [Helianthus annuus]|uniref:peptidylprolyl isomerase n=1 Tax=Helianthus annuus TaxID=4232 RepID=A0A251T4H0_HELAN|nr:peptidyl-prolyl cis-trans isomerase FKBP13, chloroplastic [Helianthus annuus]KAF5779238.1 putative peptidylprolyl isomerase [Helianthus annuus]KAJ0490528.1 putative peptidylprolyl isomerase [Helianthus annuus]KAJ0494776.1 putative peptidylprolyl isomerase [Helianthus annuus]KAJ0506447.1 putative peptidylprolyl isomerase [Helianthus annuus]KAJ0676123.1 putative peptidylprolyl isomerase [Helianthus annuus]
MATTLLPSLLSPPIKHSSTVSPPAHHHNQTISSNSISNHTLKLNLTRRETLGLGLVLTVFDAVTSPPQLARAESTPPCEFTVADSGLAFCDKLVGYGSQAVKGQLIKAHYVGKLESGKVFDSSYNRGKPLTFRIGVGEVIKGWDQGILGGDGVPPMLAGGKRTLKLPPQLGYGMRGAGCKGGSCIIPPDSVLLFDVEFIGKA